MRQILSSRSLGRRLYYATCKAVFVLAFIAGFSIYANSHPIVDHTEKPHPVGSPIAMIEAHDCWTDGNHPYPTHSVLTVVVNGEFKTIFAGKTLTDIALLGINGEYTVEGGMTIHAFCK